MLSHAAVTSLSAYYQKFIGKKVTDDSKLLLFNSIVSMFSSLALNICLLVANRAILKFYMSNFNSANKFLWLMFGELYISC